MININTYYYLLNPKAPKRTAIMLQLNSKNDKIRISTGISTVVSDWQQFKRKSKIASINTILRSIDERVEKYNNECQLMSKEIDLAELADLIKENKNGPAKKKSFVDYIQMYYDSHKQLKAPNTIKKYLSLKNFFKKYYAGSTLNDIDAKFADNLKKLSLDQKAMNNTISKRFQLIRVVLTWCEDMKYINDVNYKHLKHKKTDKIQAVILTEVEIQKIAKLDLAMNLNRELIRDLFVISCNTGIDWVDLPQLTKNNLKISAKGNKYFQIQRSKTKDKDLYSHPPCREIVINLCEKWKWNFDFISYDKSIEHLKRICELAELTENITLESFSGTTKLKITQPKYDWIAWKTARRSFITNLLTDGKQTELVSSAVGHTKTATTNKYQHTKPANMVDLLVGN